MKAAPFVGILVAIVIAALVYIFDGRVVSHAPSPSLTEIAMLSAAIESYKNDYGHYPTDAESTEKLKPNSTYDPTTYTSASAFLYRTLTESRSKPTTPASRSAKPYIEAGLLRKIEKTDKNGITYFVDAWGNSLGYSTFQSVHLESTSGNNPTFDLWSTGGGRSKADLPKWIRNW